ncbi:MAG TPA: 16S rRNA (adenine(1518)-N(6)/adenine(1519)-N(6))-dimethyltransferase RsmA [Thermomicrobiales bacterium]|jgi:16S rRNA (adenine1518-N6/adenine1519-N6)-dimethyltransferase|nr:16S rRNA (adenine(1518)-N(6)/adenine(1519)-N(6))-dimethyltransferase RsmA [Thermomicrobiales bacterium]
MTNLQRTSAEWAATLRKNRIKPTRSMGQNFLTSTEVVEEIVAISGVQPGDLVIEIGPGMGILTRQLLTAGARVIGVELDRELAALLRTELGQIDRFSLVEQDARHLDIKELTNDEPYQVVANLPYSVATVIVRSFMEAQTPPTRMTVMVQKEVAERMTATPGEMSLLGLATGLYADARIELVVPPDVFLPPPKVDSAVVVLDSRPELPGTPEQRDRMFELATMAFQRKRKTLSNGLSQGLGLPKQEVDALLSSVGIDGMRRPQTFSVDEWLTIAGALPA